MDMYCYHGWSILLTSCSPGRAQTPRGSLVCRMHCVRRAAHVHSRMLTSAKSRSHFASPPIIQHTVMRGLQSGRLACSRFCARLLAAVDRCVDARASRRAFTPCRSTAFEVQLCSSMHFVHRQGHQCLPHAARHPGFRARREDSSGRCWQGPGRSAALRGHDDAVKAGQAGQPLPEVHASNSQPQLLRLLPFSASAICWSVLSLRPPTVILQEWSRVG